MKRILFTALLVALLFSVVASAFEGVTVFQAGHGAKALAMGGAFVAVADGPDFQMWNPAGTVSKATVPDTIWLGSTGSNLFTIDGFVGASYFYTSAGIVLEPLKLSVGASLAHVQAGSLYTADLIIGTASAALDSVRLGASVKRYSQTVVDNGKSGFGFDAGMLWTSDFGLSVGISARDLLGTNIGDEQYISSTYLAGAAYTATVDELDLTVAADFEAGHSGRLHIGAELLVFSSIGLRCGASIPTERDCGNITAMSAGIGLSGATLGIPVTVDVAYVHDGPLGGTWVVSALWAF